MVLCVFQLAMVFSEVLFEDESKVVHPQKPGTSLSIPLKIEKAGFAFSFTRSSFVLRFQSGLLRTALT